MAEQIIEVCKRIKALSVCSSCGGKYKQDVCIYCQTKNNELTELIFKLNNLVNNFRNQVKLSYIIGVNILFNYLYSINSFEIYSVNKLLLDANYHIVLENNFQNIIKKINEGATLKTSDYEFLSFFLINNQFKDDIKLYVTNTLIKGIANREYVPDVDSLNDLVKIFVEESVKNVIGLKGAKCKIVEYEKEKIGGSTIFGTILVNRNQINHLVQGNITYLFNTLFHEMIHVLQYQRRKNGNISTYDMLQIKDCILSELNRDYYENNYYLLSTENQAFLNEGKETLSYMSKLGIKPSEKEIEDINKNHEFHRKIYGVTTRLWNGKPCDIETLFDSVIFDNPKILAQYPQLSLEYVVENNVVRRKTTEELQSEYNDYLNGKLKLNGSQEEIISYFDNLLSMNRKIT